MSWPALADTTIWSPIPGPQTALVTCPVFEVFYGGARGGGKTDGVLGEWLSHADKYGEHAIGLMVRRERTQLIETIERSRMLYAPLGAKYHEQDKMWRFPNGARLRFAYLESDSDADAYQGHSYTRVYVEEVGTFPRPEPVLKLMATLRSGAGVPVGFRATGNPGGPGHNWVRARYIDPAPFGWAVGTRSFRNPFTGAEVSRDWVYIPSRLADNHYLGDEYVANLFMSGSPALVKAWLEGDWSAIEGAFFDCWQPLKHIVRPFAVPEDWLRFRSMDWGSAAPFSVGWWAVVGDEFGHLPRGCLVRYREWYGQGHKLTAEEVAHGIMDREVSDAHLIRYGVLDPSAFAQDGGPSIAERMHAAARATGRQLLFRPADNKRVSQKGAMGGWDQMRARMKGGEDGRPMLVTFSTCVDFIRTIPVLQHDKDKPEDLDSESEDHCFAAGTLIETVRGPVPIEQLVGHIGDVHSWGGLQPYRSGRLVAKQAETVWLTFEDGRRVRCTPDHLFLTEQGWRAAVDLTDEWSYDMGCSIQSSSRQRSRSLKASATTNAGATSRGMASGFIASFGSALRGLSLRASMFTTSMATAATMPFQTSMRYPDRITLAKSTGQRAALGAWKRSKSPDWQPRHGTAPKLGGHGTPRTMTFTYGQQCSAGFLRRVRNAARGTWSLLLGWLKGDFAVTTARLVRCVSVEKAPKADVYCLTVPATGSFAIEGGIIVANCADEARYACMSRPWVAQPAPKLEPRPMMVGPGNKVTLEDAWRDRDVANMQRQRI